MKEACALSRLPYFDVVKDYALDGMHLFMNIVQQHHRALLGDGWGVHVYNYARNMDLPRVTKNHFCDKLPAPESTAETIADRVASVYKHCTECMQTIVHAYKSICRSAFIHCNLINVCKCNVSMYANVIVVICIGYADICLSISRCAQEEVRHGA